jgi:hypothetical protein
MWSEYHVWVLAGRRRHGDAILAFVCCIQSSRALVLVVTCASLPQLTHLQQHPAMSLVQQYESRCAGQGNLHAAYGRCASAWYHLGQSAVKAARQEAPAADRVICCVQGAACGAPGATTALRQCRIPQVDGIAAGTAGPPARHELKRLCCRHTHASQAESGQQACVPAATCSKQSCSRCSPAAGGGGHQMSGQCCCSCAQQPWRHRSAASSRRWCPRSVVSASA